MRLSALSAAGSSRCARLYNLPNGATRKHASDPQSAANEVHHLHERFICNTSAFHDTPPATRTRSPGLILSASAGQTVALQNRLKEQAARTSIPQCASARDDCARTLSAHRPQFLKWAAACAHTSPAPLGPALASVTSRRDRTRSARSSLMSGKMRQSDEQDCGCGTNQKWRLRRCLYRILGLLAKNKNKDCKPEMLSKQTFRDNHLQL